MFNKKYNLKVKSIYTQFSEYNKEIIDLVISTFKKEYNTIRLLKKQYGNNYDGEDMPSVDTLNYAESQLIVGVLSRFEDRLKICQLLLNSGKSLKEIEDLFSSKDDLQISKMIKNALDKVEENELKNNFSSLDTLLKKYDITIEELKSIIESNLNEMELFCFKYTYGIDGKSGINDICDALKINKDTYKELMNNSKKIVASALEKEKSISAPKTKVRYVIKKPKELDINNEEERQIIIEKKNKELLRTKAESDTLKTIKAARTQDSIESKNKTKKESYVSLQDRQLKSNFLSYFYEEFPTTNKKSIEDAVRKYIETSTSSYITYVIGLYGNNLDLLIPSMIDKEHITAVNATIRHIKTFLDNHHSMYFKESLYLYFVNDNMSRSERLDIKERVRKYVTNTSSKNKYIIFRIYDRNLDKQAKIKNFILTKEEKDDFNEFISSIEFNLKFKSSKKESNNEEIVVKQTPTKKGKKPKHYIDLITSKDMTPEEKQEFMNKFLELFKSQQDSKSKKLTIACYGENLDELNNIEIKTHDKTLVNNYRVKLVKKLLAQKEQPSVSIKEPDSSVKTIKETKIKKIKTYYDLFFKEDMDEITKRKIELAVIYYIKSTKSSKKQLLFKNYGEDLIHPIENIDSKEKRIINSYFGGPLSVKIKQIITQQISILEFFEKRGINKLDYLDSLLIHKIFGNYLNVVSSCLLSDEERIQLYQIYDKLIIKQKHKKSKKIIKNKYILKETLFDYFINPELDEKQINEIKNKVILFMSRTTSKHKELIIKIYGPEYNKYTGYKLNSEDRQNFAIFRCQLLKAISSAKYLEPEIIDIPEKESDNSNKDFNIDIYKLVPNAKLLMSNDLIDVNVVDKLLSNNTIVELYEQYNDSYKLLEILRIPVKSLIAIYIKYLSQFKDISEIIRFIVLNTDDLTIIHNILSSNIFNTEDGYLTDKEKEIIYLKLLQLKDSSITDDIISKISGVPIEDINNYYILTKDDKINSLNKIFTKKD